MDAKNEHETGALNALRDELQAWGLSAAITRRPDIDGHPVPWVDEPLVMPDTADIAGSRQALIKLGAVGLAGRPMTPYSGANPKWKCSEVG
jgi:hypothetical protein